MTQSNRQSLPPEVFQDLPDKVLEFYEGAFVTERATLCVASLPRPHYKSALDIGCATGVMSEKLARRSDRVLGIDISEKELQAAREHCKALTNVTFEKMTFPTDRPTTRFDAILFADLGYFWTTDDLAGVSQALIDLLEPGGHLLINHGTGHYPKFPITGDEVHEYFVEGASRGNGLKHLFRRDFWIGYDLDEDVKARLNEGKECCPVCGLPYFWYRLERHRQDVFERV